jgi:hypothetical protein
MRVVAMFRRHVGQPVELFAGQQLVGSGDSGWNLDLRHATILLSTQPVIKSKRQE